MTLEDFRAVVDVHLMGAVNCTKAVWDLMRAQHYGRIVLTTSSSGLYGNFGQANYGAAKLALVGLMQTLALEGARHNIRVNSLAPTAATRMMEGILPNDMLDMLAPGLVSPAMLALVGEDAPTRAILCAGAGGVEQAHITMTPGIFVGDAQDAPEQILGRLTEIGDRSGDIVPQSGGEQGQIELRKAGYSPAIAETA
jgi:NAD(P)-dependent dehydrogenase (short-subunit alcohol dehydrogenase family)